MPKDYRSDDATVTVCQNNSTKSIEVSDVNKTGEDKLGYPSDVTDTQWVLIEPCIPVYPGGRPRKTDARDVVDAIFYILSTGCQWQDLPKTFPPKGTVQRYLYEWRHNGTMDLIHDLLRRKVRTSEKP